MPNKPILFRDIWPINNETDYKVHFARWNKIDHPLNVWVRDPSEWQGWQQYFPGKNEFNRTFIFSLMQFYHEEDAWLFGGIFRVKGLHKDPNWYKDHYYEVELTPTLGAFIGRLKLHYPHHDRTTRVNLENHYNMFEVSEILPEPYSGRNFPGYEDIDLSFDELESLVKNDRRDWKAALSNVKGIYLISDTSTGKRYVGSAYSDGGIWFRWSSYVASGHGGNVGLRELIEEEYDLAYCRAHFRFALLEHRSILTDQEIIIERETYWKDILLSRGQGGLNRN